MLGDSDAKDDLLKSFRESSVPPITRRAFLQGSAAAMAAAAHSASVSAFAEGLPGAAAPAAQQAVYLPHFDENEQVLYQLLAPVDAAADAFHPSPLPLDGMRLVVTRATDFLHAELTFTGTSLHYGDGPHLRQTDPNVCAHVKIHLQGQHQQEEAYIEDASSGNPAAPAELTLSGETTFTCPLIIPEHGLPLTAGNLLAAINQAKSSCGAVSTSIELPYRTIIQTSEATTTYRNSEEFRDRPHQLWHLMLQPHIVRATSVKRKGNVVTIVLPSVDGWQQYQTIGILEPATLAGDFVLSDVDTKNLTITYKQAGADFSQNNVTLTLANRFLAVRALDFLPTVTAVAQTGNTVTLTFTDPPQVAVGALIYIDSVNTPCAVIAVDPSKRTLTYTLPAGAAAPTGSPTISLATTVPFTTDAGVIKTSQPTALRSGDTITFFNPVDNSTVDAKVDTPDQVDTAKSKVDKPDVVAKSFLTTLQAGSPKPPQSGHLVFSLSGMETQIKNKIYPVSARDRHNLVAQSTGGDVPMAVDQMVFSALGAWFSAQATFKPQSRYVCAPPAPGAPPCPPPWANSLEKYIYRMAQGRDYYVEVDDTGFLLPYGHEAVLIKITRRAFYSVTNPSTPPQNICFLRQQRFVVVRQKTRILRTVDGTGNGMPFQQVDILTKITPALYAAEKPDPKDIYDANRGDHDYFWPSITKGNLFSFDLAGYDGTEPRTAIPFSQPLLFISTEISNSTDCSAHYNTESLYKRWRQADFGGQTLHFAPSVRTGDTQLHAGPMSFLVSHLSTDPNAAPSDRQSNYVLPDEPQVMYRPILDWAAVDVPSLRVFTGNSAAISAGSMPPETTPIPADNTPPPLSFPSGYVKVTYDPLYIQSGFTQANVAEVYLRVDSPSTGSSLPSSAALSFPGQQGGGAATPTSPVKALSRSHGITNQDSKSATNTANGVTTTTYTADVTFDPKADFAGIDLEGFLQAKILGCISMSDIVGSIADIAGSLNMLPSMQLNQIYDTAEQVENIFQSLNNTLLQPLKDAISALQVATSDINQRIDTEAASLVTTIASFLMGISGLSATNAEVVPVLPVTPGAPGMAPVATARAGAAACAPPLAVFYKGVSDGMNTALNAIAAEVQAEIKASGIADIAAEDYEKLRIAADLSLNSALWPVIYQQYLQKPADGTILTLDTAARRLQKDILNNIGKLLSSEQRPLDQLLTAVTGFLALLNNILALKEKPADAVSDLRKQASLLVSTFTRSLRQMGLGLQNITLQKQVYTYYYNDLLPSGKTTTSGLHAQLQNSLDKLKADLKSTVHAHTDAFNAVWADIKSAHALKPTAPTTVDSLVSSFNTAIAQGADAAIDCLFLSDTVQQAIGDAQIAFVKASQVTDAQLAALNDTLSKIAGIEDQITGIINLLETPVSISGTYTLDSIPLQDGPADNPIFLAHNGDQKAVLRIDATVSASATPISPTSVTFDYSVKAGIYDFSLVLLPSASFITVSFSEFSYTASRSAGTKFTCKLASVQSVLLDEALGFIASLASAFGPLDDDDDGADDDGDEDEDSDSGGGKAGLSPILHLSGFGLTVGYELTVPPIQAGGFQLVNFGFSIALVISFANDPLKLQFYFASPDKHFLMSAGIFGGGGFLGLELRPNGVDDVRGAMEFGACAGLNLGVASGEVHIFGGVYFDFGDQQCVLTGYVRAGGSLRIIDLITMSLEFYLGITYEEDKISGATSVSGDCTITVSISILFFSADVSVDMHWQWAGNNVNSAHSTSASLQPALQQPAVAAAELLAVAAAPGTLIARASPPSPIAQDAATPQQKSNSAAKCNPRTEQWTSDWWEKYTKAFR